jgi:hypothetical protein
MITISLYNNAYNIVWISMFNPSLMYDVFFTVLSISNIDVIFISLVSYIVLFINEIK